MRNRLITLTLALLVVPFLCVAATTVKIRIGNETRSGGLWLSDGSSNYVKIEPQAISADYTLTLPTTDGSANQELYTDGSGGLAWRTDPDSFTIATGAVPFASDTDTLSGDEVDFTWDDTANASFLMLGSGTGPGAIKFLEGSGTGTNKITLTIPTSASDGTVTLPASGTLATLTGTETLTNKTLTAPTINSPTCVTPVLGVATGTSLAVTGLLTTATPSAAFGYATGAGGTVTQATDKSTGVTMSPNPCKCGTITMNNATLNAATIVSFTVTNSAIGATDVMVLNHVSGGTLGAYTLNAACGAGSAVIYVRNNTAGNLSEAIVISFVIIDGVTS